MMTTPLLSLIFNSKPTIKVGVLTKLTFFATASALAIMGSASLHLLWRKWRDTRRWFFPFNLTSKNRYYFHGRGGTVYVRRQTDMSTIVESPIPTLGNVCVYSSFFNIIQLKAFLKAERLDHDHVKTYYDLKDTSLHLFGNQVWPLLEETTVPSVLVYAEENVAMKGYIDLDGKPRVMLQLAPYVGCDLSQAEYEELTCRTSKTPNLSYLEFNSKEMDVLRSDIPAIAAAIKKEYHSTSFEPWFGTKKTDGDGDVTAKLTTGEVSVQEEDKPRPAGCLFPPPVDQPSIVYEVNKAAETVTYAERVKKFVQTKEAQWPAQYDKYTNELLQFLVPEKDKNKLVLDELFDVLERQKRPTQVKGFEEVQDNVYAPLRTKDKTFQKNEVYPEFKAPRNIVNPEPQLRVFTGMIAHPLAKYLKEGPLKHIYGFGDAPYLQETFNRISRMDQGLGKYLLDGKKLDAHIHSKLRAFEEKLCLRAFTLESSDRVKELHQAQYMDSSPMCAFRTAMKLYWSRRSGEGGTSIFNTVCMLLVCYSMLREQGFSPKDAWARVGCHGGDDVAMVRFVDRETVVRVSGEMMIPLTIETAEKDEPWSFLGLTRLHDSLDVFVCDVNRFVGKAAFSHVKNVPANELILRKMDPYSRMYGEMPLVGNLARACVRLLNAEKFISQDKYDELTRYSNGFMYHVLDNTCLPGPRTEQEVHLVETYICKQLDIGLVHLREICRSYDEAKSFSEFPTGYVKKPSVLADCAFECIFRDLYIQGAAPSKLVSTLPTESPDGCTKPTNGETKVKAKTNSSQSPEPSSDASSLSTNSEKRKRTRTGKKERRA